MEERKQKWAIKKWLAGMPAKNMGAYQQASKAAVYRVILQLSAALSKIEVQNSCRSL